MGVTRTDYLVYGAKLPYDAVDYDRHEALIEGRPGVPFNIICDGMSGEYAVAGKIIAKTDGYDGGVFIEITDDLLPADPAKLRADIVEALGDGGIVPELKLLFFSHYS